jgi:tetratricopeptide (TPR) repeat protein
MKNAFSGGRIGKKGRRGRSLLQLFVVLVAVLLVVVPIAFSEFPHEIARWYRAAAEEKWLDGDVHAAAAHLDRALEWFPTDPELYLRRAEFKLDIKDWTGGLKDCEQALDLNPDLVLVEQLQATLLQHLGRHREAVEIWKRINRDDPGASSRIRAHYLNGLAYSCAVGQLELEQGLAAIQQAMELAANPVAQLDPAGLLYFGRGCLALERGQQAVALDSFNQAAILAAKRYEDNLERAAALVSIPREALEYEQRADALLPHLLGILKQRAALLDELDETEQAASDRERIQELAPAGGSSSGAPMDLYQALDLVSRTAGMLDTRGYLFFLQNDLPAAQRDLEQATEGMEWMGRAFEWLIESEKNYSVDVRPLQWQKKEIEHSMAVIRYHLMLAHEAVGKTEEATADRQRIVELGYEPNPDLF